MALQMQLQPQPCHQGPKCHFCYKQASYTFFLKGGERLFVCESHPEYAEPNSPARVQLGVIRIQYGVVR